MDTQILEQLWLNLASYCAVCQTWTDIAIWCFCLVNMRLVFMKSFAKFLQKFIESSKKLAKNQQSRALFFRVEWADFPILQYTSRSETWITQLRSSTKRCLSWRDLVARIPQNWCYTMNIKRSMPPSLGYYNPARIVHSPSRLGGRT